VNVNDKTKSIKINLGKRGAYWKG